MTDKQIVIIIYYAITVFQLASSAWCFKAAITEPSLIGCIFFIFMTCMFTYSAVFQTKWKYLKEFKN